ncbi:hypothetical protein FJT64_023149 [Amphibalanus amphitrite]|uniref:Uncharacterized protein n=1 Tax=Amphibalanus amphitrite TaxID=1232801 RepID=A0A6A4WN29_AMPAM|nr:annexin A7-like [Amphibalanus amphitrite]XP_043239400.1 annexin A7-like [Amphibalanus amphitrite]XP_043239401.1 annexin A7-like [Amphibalanus amphitrite]XP_043239402.1 annexin A7-like [Amphibalanus amphitrite]XP_043239403.1 annexin A7-like [Amphibalanus amphitrite]XP_043239404.1 annexin A7-like [Amphibalanus amphitrite]XP_043239405.1 annexin A7-like [Amphibalanus amphitrite]XP_043239406.1 annexin A7-like [Amphibalanus amphitrite]XP_043239407.1 annexin A7-like [Amphibalanus amphitrite]KA
MEDLGQTQALVRKRRDFFDAAEACSGKYGDDKTECLCEHGEDFWCDHWESSADFSELAMVVSAVIVFLLFLSCLICICRRRRRGFVFRSPSGRTVTTTTAVVQPPLQSHGPAASHVPGTSFSSPSQMWLPPGEGGFPQPPAGYSQPSTGYQQPQGGYPQQQGSYPPQGGYPQQQGAYPQQQGGYPPQGGHSPQVGFAHAPPPSGGADLPPPYDAVTGRQPPFNPNFQEGGDTKRPM